jgi:hypothetical protein
MGLVAAFEATCEQLPLVEGAAAVPAAALTVEMRPNEDGHTLFVLRATHDDPAAVDAALSDAEFVAEHTLVRERANARRYHVRPALSMAETYDESFDVEGLQALAHADARIDARRASLAEVADELGVGTSALSERLRRAQAHLVERTLSPPRPSGPSPRDT